MLKAIVDWLESRTGLESAVKRFLYEDIPKSSGWHQVLGSLALFGFLLQAFTGVLLAFNYAPTPGEAYNSLKYIITELTGGRVIRNLHHWGASLMVIVVVLHMIQVFVWGAYKKPREATWMAGVTLLLVTLAFGLTGYLLPWDNKAYWGTVVTAQIAASAPLLGEYVQRLLGSDSSIGVVTFARFYALHVLLLPPITTLLIVLHVFLVRRHGVAPKPGEVETKKFFPEQVFKDTLAIFIVFAALVVVSIVLDAPLGRLADPTDTSYIPRPEWYFLFLFQTLKFFEGSLEIIGSVVLPTLAILALFLVPFLDRGSAAPVKRRLGAIGVVLVAIAGWGGLTAAAILSTPPSAEGVTAGGVESWQELSPEELAGVGYFRKENCVSCHPLGREGTGPDLTRTAITRSASWMIEHFKQPAQMVPGTSMPPIQLNNAQLNALAAFLLKLNERNAQALHSAPQFAVDGALIYQQFRCGACHQVNGAGTAVGPSLNGLAARRTAEWVEGHFADPQKYSPGTVMPPYRFNQRDMHRIVTWLMQLP